MGAILECHYLPQRFKKKMSNMIFVIVLVLSMFSAAAGHGYLMNPAARNSMWRFGFDNPKNYNDNELFCGGFRHHWVINKGKCGICGDPYGAKVQPHMDGGRYAKNKLIAKTYKRGQVIEVSARLTTTHKGYFQFRIGNYDNSIPKADKMGRLSGYLLKVVGGGDKFMLPNGSAQLRRQSLEQEGWKLRILPNLPPEER